MNAARPDRLSRRRTRSLREARRLIGRAAQEIAATPAEWIRVVDRTRAELGLGPLPPEAVRTGGFSILSTEEEGRPRSCRSSGWSRSGRGG